MQNSPQEVDMALGPFALLLSRARATSMTQPVVVDPLSATAGRQTAETNPWGFILTLSPLTWLGMLVSLVVITVTLVVLSIIDNTDGRNTILKGFGVFFEFLRCVLQQGEYNKTRQKR